ncbi:hypothetical protein O181_092458 [Austropuccinia psidii MF-1]|uniref:Uncharacterized protein n=1 Tax=Austropuccinia psidii MF-1 TaxID=1389203 RepID=A0A9Q3IYK7_9BASI|nr:hypothetical protein [Austropuccinia psidii MF-1]
MLTAATRAGRHMILFAILLIIFSSIRDAIAQSGFDDNLGLSSDDDLGTNPDGSFADSKDGNRSFEGNPDITFTSAVVLSPPRPTSNPEAPASTTQWHSSTESPSPSPILSHNPPAFTVAPEANVGQTISMGKPGMKQSSCAQTASKLSLGLFAMGICIGISFINRQAVPGT